MRQFFPALAVAATLVACELNAQATMPECRLRVTSKTTYTGRCVWHDTTVALLVLRPPSHPPTGRWEGINIRIFGHGGDTSDVVDWTAFSPAMVDVGATGDGVYGGTLGWLAVRQATIDSSGFGFSVDLGTAVPPTTADLQILRAVRAYFSDSTRWNHVDRRRSAIVNCPGAPAPRTLFCAFYIASQEVAGEFFGWRPAGAALQAAIAAASPRRYQHPVTDFNNDSVINFATIQAVVDDAIHRVGSKLGTR
jgi:hypothetical protein